MANLFRCGGGRSEASYQNIMDQLIEETATGSIASFTDGANNIPAKEIICHINPTETGTGEKSPSNPYVIGGFTKCKITRAGKNLFNKNGDFSQGYINDSGEFVTNANIRLYETPVFVNQTVYSYLKSVGTVRIVEYTANGEFIRRSVYTANTGTFTPQLTTNYILINPDNNTVDALIFEVGSTATDYESYTADTYTTEFGQTVYGGTLNVTTGVLMVTHVYITFDGSSDENWLGYTLGNGWQITINDMKSGTHFNDIGALCNILPKSNNANTFGARIGNNNKVLYLVQINTLGITDLSSLKQWLSNNNVSISYPLEEPITIQLTPTEIKTLLGANNIYHDCDGDIDVTYRANGALYVQEHPITRGLMAVRPTEQIQEQEEQQEEKEIIKSEDNER